MLAANTNFNTYLALLTASILGATGLQTSVASAVAHLFGIYSGGRALTVSRTITRLAAVAVTFIPVFFNDWHTDMRLFWVMTGLMGLGLITSCFLNPFSLVQEPTTALERCNTSGNRNKYKSIQF
jgi:hypothetical protein